MYIAYACGDVCMQKSRYSRCPHASGYISSGLQYVYSWFRQYHEDFSRGSESGIGTHRQLDHQQYGFQINNHVKSKSESIGRLTDMY